MRHLILLVLVAVAVATGATPAARAQTVTRDVPYAGVADDPRRTLDVYAPAGAKNLPVVFWIHGGDPARVLVGGHAAGAQLAALLCTDDKYLKAEGVPFDVLKGCIPVDGDTYDIPAMIELAETRWRLHGTPPHKYGHRLKFGNDPALHRDFSPVTHVAKGKGIPPFLILHVADHPDVSAQAFRLAAVLKEAGVPAQAFAAQDTTHAKLNDHLGQPDDPATKAVEKFVAETVKK